MAEPIVPTGFVVKYVPEKPGIVAGMFWRKGDEDIFLCDYCSLKELKSIEPPLVKIEKGWDAIQEELDKRGHHAATYHPDASIRCKRCGLSVPVKLQQT